jgi:hypothetical protein
MAIQEGGKFEGLQGNSSDFLKVLLALKKNIMRDLHVGTLATVVGINQTDLTFSVKPFPLLNEESEKAISCISLQNLVSELAEGDVVLVNFLDRDFIQALKQIKLGQKPSAISKSSETHSESYGIIIGIVYSMSQNNSDD